MGVLDYVSQPGQKVAYLFPEIPFTPGTAQSIDPTGGLVPPGKLQDVFVFQFWPQQVSDNYQVNYATKNIPGASHPLYQWTGGGGRTISFEATFVSEIAEDSAVAGTSFNTLIQRDTGVLAGTPATSLANAVTAMAHDTDNYDRAFEFEQMGTKVVELPRSTFEYENN